MDLTVVLPIKKEWKGKGKEDRKEPPNRPHMLDERECDGCTWLELKGGGIQKAGLLD